MFLFIEIISILIKGDGITMGKHHEWTKEDLSNYNHAKRPWYTIDLNGKVDIGNEFGDQNKISLEEKGMFNLVKHWIVDTNKAKISKEQKEELIKLLSE